MTTNPFEEELNVAKHAVSRAARVTASVQAQLLRGGTLIKEDRSPVTVADFASQAIVCTTVHETFAGDIIVGEETADDLRDGDNDPLCKIIGGHVNIGLSAQFTHAEVLDLIDKGNGKPVKTGRFWTLDPIDGTKGFLRGEQYVVALALIEHGRVVLGALACPNMLIDSQKGVLVTAVRGLGAWQQPLDSVEDESQVTRIHVDLTDDPRELRFCEPMESEHADHDTSSRIARGLGISQPALRMDSMAKYVTVARGDAAIYMRMPTSPDRRENIWDHAAGSIIVEEAGGRVSDVHGNPLDFGQGKKLEHNWGILATNGKIHEHVLNIISGLELKV